IPAGRSHSGRLTAGVTLCDAFFADVRGALPGDEATVVVMTPVLESLLMYLGQNTIADDQRARAEAVVFDVLLPSDRELAVTVPRDAAVVPIVEALLADPSDRRSLTRWASEMAVSERTITRAFRTSTGLSFAQWRQTVRVHRAMSLLAEGTEVGEVAELIGYAQTGTFIDAFRRVMGTTPGSFQAAVRAERVRKN
ncbi:MAG: helix-turn-helix transcriptional regulator, partial [Mycetocola sp.]